MLAEALIRKIKVTFSALQLKDYVGTRDCSAVQKAVFSEKNEGPSLALQSQAARWLMSQSHIGFQNKRSPAEGQPQSKAGSASIRQKGYGKPFTTHASLAASSKTAASTVPSITSPKNNRPSRVYWDALAAWRLMNKATAMHWTPQTLCPPGSCAADE